MAKAETIIPKSGNVPYVVAVVIMMAIAVTGSVILSISRPDQDNTILIAAIFGFLTPTTVSILAFMKAQETHLSVNSRLDKLILSEGQIARAEGHAQGVIDANARTDAIQTKL